MSCENVRDLISPLLDRQVAGEARDSMASHLKGCRDCRAHLESIQKQREQLRAMGGAPIPAGLATRLRVAASYERERRLMGASFMMRLKHWQLRLRLFFDNLMRPVALPFAGGVTSAVACFSVLLPLFTFPHDFRDGAFSTAPLGTLVAQGPNGMYLGTGEANLPRIESLDTLVPDGANVVELTIDKSGRVSDWSVVRGKITRDIENIIMLSKFLPARYLGVPTSGKVKAVQYIPTRSMRS